MHDIAIIGTGIAGLQLALQLQKHGLQPTLYAEVTPEEMRAARLRRTVLLFSPALDRMRELGVHHWDDPKLQVHRFDFGIKDHPELSFAAPLDRPVQFIDMRLSLPRLLEDFAARGGRVVTCGRLDPERLSDLAAAHDLVIVAAGSGRLAAMFSKLPKSSPYDQPQRRVMSCLLQGVELPVTFEFVLQLVPGVGEMCEYQLLTSGEPDPRPVSVLQLEAVPGGPLEAITRLRYQDDPGTFNSAVLAILREYHPKVYERIADPSAFEVLGSRHVTQGAVLPVVRHGVVELSPGRFGLALGDTHITHDPIIGQGANAASQASWFLGEQLCARADERAPLDREFCNDIELRMRELIEPTTLWCNASLAEPPPHIFQLLAAAHKYPSVAKAYINNNDDPQTQWAVLSDAAATEAFIQKHANPSAPATASS